jgi:phosphomannomutase
MSQTLDRAKKFLAEDPDPETRKELGALLAKVEAGDAAAKADLEDRFAGTLTFGTAGLRGRVEAGSARMNRSVVIQATWGLGTYLLDVVPDAKKRGVVIGFDGRLSSRQFAEDAAGVLAAQGIPVHIHIDPVSTPMCAFSVEKLGVCAGIMVTASHNPPADNGYKVYWGNAAQIIPPHDTGIAACIAKAPAANVVARMPAPDAARAGLRHLVGDDLERAYLDGVRAVGWHKPPTARQHGLQQAGDPLPLRIVYTAMHGVGHRTTIRALAEAGFTGVIDVPTQADPDGTFRTVAFPNPEEKGALDRALEVARENRAEIILANDPDADRLAVAVSVDEGKTFRLLTGNEIGILLCADALDHAPVPAGTKKLVITTIVSSTFLSRMAKDKGAAYAETLTGFKWIANQAMDRRKNGEEFVCGYEEALGYSLGHLVRDKDGVGAAVRFAEMTRSLKAKGMNLLQRLDELSVAHGLSHATNWSVTMPGATGMEKIKGAMTSLRKEPIAALDGKKVVRSEDYSNAAVPSDVVVFHTEDGARLTVRPSGTEPKIKLYYEMVARVSSTGELAGARTQLEQQGERVKLEVSKRLGF